MIGTLRDITEMKRTEEVLRNTEKLVFAGQVAVSIAHEVRNPLTTVKGLLQLAHRDTPLRHYDLMMSELERANLIVGEFMILGKPQATVFKLEDCGGILEEVLQLFEIQTDLNDIEITCTLGAERHHPMRPESDQAGVSEYFEKWRWEALPYGGHIHVRLDVWEGYQRIPLPITAPA
ncbi:histidine kinase dimerization/phospho-acceptor domain-containing protein [Paenibacillus ihbetae]|uniref:histidine kinase dimerization/phospho-acceptor domain-containing protein n=1 Tax=Paenibacillus ihbetae TaxID=1870820 RepID=UPI001CB8BCA4|nr:histidine kinase dimerization/phospho-acceptor domain-containing protein [Paenibacillus ihbetae]